MHLTKQNLQEYIKSNYGDQTCQKEKEIEGFKPLLQKDYGGPNDCTLTSITAVLSYITNYQHTFEDVYKCVEKNAEKNFYEIDGKGTWTPAIRTIFNNSAKKYTNKTSCVHYGKGFGYNYEDIKKQIDKNNPIVLSMYSDGLDYYKNHSVTIIGYKDYGNAKIIQIYDNWHRSCSYLDYNKLSIPSSIHCLCSKIYPLLDWLWKIITFLFAKKQ